MNILKSLYRLKFRNRTPLDEIHKYWGGKQVDTGNTPSVYVEQDGMVQLSLYLVNLISQYNGKSILEIGCNAGRNLHYLFQNGYTQLSGIEINADAINHLRGIYPELSSVKVYHSSIEDIIFDFSDNQFDIVFTSAVLYHIHYQSEWIFKEMVRIAGEYLVTIENEWAVSDWRHFPRNYKKVFSKLGMKPVFEEKLNDVPEMRKFYSGFVARVFERKN